MSAGKKLTVTIAAGGTAGHINPALALAEELSSRGHTVSFVGQKRRREGTLVPAAGFSLFNLEVSGLDRSRPWTALSALVRLMRARKSLNAHFEKSGSPDVAVGLEPMLSLPLACGASAIISPSFFMNKTLFPVWQTSCLLLRPSACACRFHRPSLLLRERPSQRR